MNKSTASHHSRTLRQKEHRNYILCTDAMSCPFARSLWACVRGHMAQTAFASCSLQPPTTNTTLSDHSKLTGEVARSIMWFPAVAYTYVDGYLKHTTHVIIHKQLNMWSLQNSRSLTCHHVHSWHPGNQSSRHCPIRDVDIVLATLEGCTPLDKLNNDDLV